MKEVTGLLVMDVDGTLIQQEGIDLLAQEAGPCVLCGIDQEGIASR